MQCMRSNVLSRESEDEQSFEAQGRLFGRVLNDEYRKAVSRIVKDIQREKDWDDEQLAERLGVSESTVANARKGNQGNLDAVTMLNLGALFGGADRLRPILALINGGPSEELTLADRTKAIRVHLDAIEREAGA